MSSLVNSSALLRSWKWQLIDIS